MGWYEAPVDLFVATLLVDLCDAVWALKREKMEVKTALADAMVKMELQKKETARLKLANEALSAGNRATSQKSGMSRLWIFGVFASLAAGALLVCFG